MKLKTNMAVSPATYSGLCLHEIDWADVTRRAGNVWSIASADFIIVVGLEMTTKQQKTIYFYLRMVHVSVPCRKNCSVIERERWRQTGQFELICRRRPHPLPKFMGNITATISASMFWLMILGECSSKLLCMSIEQFSMCVCVCEHVMGWVHVPGADVMAFRPHKIFLKHLNWNNISPSNLALKSRLRTRAYIHPIRCVPDVWGYGSRHTTHAY